MSQNSSELIALKLLEESEIPIGAAKLSQAWKNAGLKKSEATAGRYLRELDSLGFSVQSGGNRGRQLTAFGLARLNQLDGKRRQEKLQTQIWRALNASDLSDLVDLLHLRRMVEIEATRLAAVRASEDEISTLEAIATQSIHDHSKSGSSAKSIDFHRFLATLSHNRMLNAVAQMLLDPAYDPLERALGYISEESGVTVDHLEDHIELIEALRYRNPDLAVQVMALHLDKLIATVEQYREVQHSEVQAAGVVQISH